MTLERLQQIRQWHLAHRREHPVECHLWDAVVTLWVLGWTGWLPAFAMGDAVWAMPACLLALRAPDAYVQWRARAHHAQRVRCDWLDD